MRKRENKCVGEIEPQDVAVPVELIKNQNRKRGAPPGNRNAFKTGRHTKQTKQRRAVLREFRNRATLLIAMVESEIAGAHQ